MSKYRDEFVNEFHNRLFSKFSLDSDTKDRMEDPHRKIMTEWYDRFFTATVDNDYINFLYKIGETHMINKIEQEWINSMLSFVRLWIHEKIFQNVDDDVRRKGILLSVHKLMDMNYDVLNNSYFESTVSKYTLEFSLKKFVINISENFSLLMHIVLVSVLILLTMLSTVIFGNEALHLISLGSDAMQHADHALITALGSLLIIWVLVELLHTEIAIIKGGQFKISIFIGVALIAFIRDLLIITLKHEGSQTTYIFILSSILILGLIYWLVVKTEK